MRTRIKSAIITPKGLEDYMYFFSQSDMANFLGGTSTTKISQNLGAGKYIFEIEGTNAWLVVLTKGDFDFVNAEELASIIKEYQAKPNHKTRRERRERIKYLLQVLDDGSLMEKKGQPEFEELQQLLRYGD